MRDDGNDVKVEDRQVLLVEQLQVDPSVVLAKEIAASLMHVQTDAGHLGVGSIDWATLRISTEPSENNPRHIELRLQVLGRKA